MPIRTFLKEWRSREIASRDPAVPGSGRRNNELHQISHMSLAEFKRSGKRIRVRSRLLGEDVLFVATHEVVEGYPVPGLVSYTADELAYLVDVTPQELLHLHAIKKMFDGRIEN